MGLLSRGVVLLTLVLLVRTEDDPQTAALRAVGRDVEISDEQHDMTQNTFIIKPASSKLYDYNNYGKFRSVLKFEQSIE